MPTCPLEHCRPAGRLIWPHATPPHVEVYWIWRPSSSSLLAFIDCLEQSPSRIRPSQIRCEGAAATATARKSNKRTHTRPPCPIAVRSFSRRDPLVQCSPHQIEGQAQGGSGDRRPMRSRNASTPVPVLASRASMPTSEQHLSTPRFLQDLAEAARNGPATILAGARVSGAA